ncbi:VOC family protein [Paenibacillus sp. MBLB4367]|uniref:VOC family protein n=1 Tax=Paenibacillus sp. MBLB4367 TaxID=3384767 RepID=UPI0039082FC3
MITHFADLQLQTVSIPSVKRFYHERLQFPIVHESHDRIRFQPTPHVTLTFREVYEPVAPAHFAFEVPYSKFDLAIEMLRHNGILLQAWSDGREIDSFETGKNVYFRDCDGNLLELIAHPYIQENILEPSGPYHLLYLREIGFPVESVPLFRDWLQQLFGMKMDKVSETFTFAIGGTAHAVVVSKQRKWIPIAMLALPPKMEVTLGVSSPRPIEKVKSLLQKDSSCSFSETDTGLCIVKDGYILRLTLSTFDPELLPRLNLPFSI